MSICCFWVCAGTVKARTRTKMLVELAFKAMSSLTRHGMVLRRRAAKACVSRRSALIVTQSMVGGRACVSTAAMRGMSAEPSSAASGSLLARSRLEQERRCQSTSQSRRSHLPRRMARRIFNVQRRLVSWAVQCVDGDAECGSTESMCVKHCVLFDVRNEH